MVLERNEVWFSGSFWQLRTTCTSSSQGLSDTFWPLAPRHVCGTQTCAGKNINTRTFLKSILKIFVAPAFDKGFHVVSTHFRCISGPISHQIGRSVAVNGPLFPFFLSFILGIPWPHLRFLHAGLGVHHHVWLMNINSCLFVVHS